jgi:hypothetical protein
MTEGSGDYGTSGKNRIVQETQIVDMYIFCFGVRINMVNEFSVWHHRHGLGIPVKLFRAAPGDPTSLARKAR